MNCRIKAASHRRARPRRVWADRSESRVKWRLGPQAMAVKPTFRSPTRRRRAKAGPVWAPLPVRPVTPVVILTSIWVLPKWGKCWRRGRRRTRRRLRSTWSRSTRSSNRCEQLLASEPHSVPSFPSLSVQSLPLLLTVSQRRCDCFNVFQ